MAWLASPNDVVVEFYRAFNANDARAYGALFAEDGEFTNVFGQVATGPSGVEAFHAPFFREPRTEGMPLFVGCDLTELERRVRMLRSDIALVDTKWRMTRGIAPWGEPWGPRIGLVNAVVTRESDGWKIAAFHNMDLPLEPVQKQA